MQGYQASRAFSLHIFVNIALLTIAVGDIVSYVQVPNSAVLLNIGNQRLSYFFNARAALRCDQKQPPDGFIAYFAVAEFL